MATTFEWHDLTITVSEMNRAQGVACSHMINELLLTNADLVSKADWLGAEFAIRSPFIVRRGDVLLGNGTHIVGDNVTLHLPLTTDGLNALPASLAGEWVNAATKENGYLAQSFLVVLRTLAETLSVPQSGNR